MMLSTDMCLAFDANVAAAGCKGAACDEFVNGGVPLLAQTHDCCAWVEPKFAYDHQIYTEDETFRYCGTDFTSGFFGANTEAENNRQLCCTKGNKQGTSGERKTSFGDCDLKRDPQGPAIKAIIEFAQNDKFWL
jgi:hypothetical protein